MQIFYLGNLFSMVFNGVIDGLVFLEPMYIMIIKLNKGILLSLRANESFCVSTL